MYIQLLFTSDEQDHHMDDRAHAEEIEERPASDGRLSTIPEEESDQSSELALLTQQFAIPQSALHET
eukprot:240114-Amphidinium_carterae.1